MSFSVAAQTVLLPPADAYDDKGVLLPGNDKAPTTLNFRINEGDTSKVILDISTPDGDTHRLVFTKAGKLDRLGLVVPEKVVEPETTDAELRDNNTDAELIAQGRDPSAFDAMTYKAPINPDSAQRDDGISIGAPAVPPAYVPPVPPGAVTASPAPANPPADSSGRAMGKPAPVYDPKRNERAPAPLKPADETA